MTYPSVGVLQYDQISSQLHFKSTFYGRKMTFAVTCPKIPINKQISQPSHNGSAQREWR